ncbi:MAG: replication initiator protein [Microvirus sp.]|nr:MAG: replication initiator protein [Microvirus sp.]
MKCSAPVDLEHGPVPCGRCMSCRINKSAKWTGKLLLEAESHADKFSYFATFTYREPNPVSLNKNDGRLARKALLHRIPSMRFFWIGEYGDKLERPHYHAVLFGVGLEVDITDVLEKSWPHGFVYVDHLTPERAAYVAQYCQKKITGPKADNHYGSRLPEFSQMSRRPGLGDETVRRMADWYQSAAGQATLKAHHDVVGAFRTGGRTYPLTNRHIRMLRAGAGLPERRADVYVGVPLAEQPPMDLNTRADIAGRRQREHQIAKKQKIKQSTTRRAGSALPGLPRPLSTGSLKG